MSLETVYVGYDNQIELEFLEDGLPLPFNAATRFDLTFCGTNVTISESAPSNVIFGDSQGVLTLNLGSVNLGVPNGTYSSVIKVFDASHPNGQLITSPKSSTLPDLKIRIKGDC